MCLEQRHSANLDPNFQKETPDLSVLLKVAFGVAPEYDEKPNYFIAQFGEFGIDGMELSESESQYWGFNLWCSRIDLKPNVSLGILMTWDLGDIEKCELRKNE